MSIKAFYVLVLAVVISCASGGGTSYTRRDSSLITEQELSVAQESNAYDLVSKLRPNFLKTRGRSSINAATEDRAVVFLDGQFYGDLTALRNLVPGLIREIRYIPGTDAVVRYGMQYGNGIIDVRSK